MLMNLQVVAELRQRTQEGWPKAHHMMVPVEQGHFLKWLVAALNVRKAVEVGVFTGSSALAIAQVCWAVLLVSLLASRWMACQ